MPNILERIEPADYAVYVEQFEKERIVKVLPLKQLILK
jgi:hypothetical protein